MRSVRMKKNLLITTSLLSGFLFTILIIMLIFDFNHSTFKLSKLVKYIENEDNYLSVSKYYNLNVKTSKDTLTIDISNDETNDSLIGTLNNNVLTFYIPKNDKNILLKGKLLFSIADGIGQFNGNDKGYVSSILGSLDYSKMKIKNNGIEIYSDEDQNVYKFRVNDKFQLGSAADVYFTTDDFNEFKDKLTSDDYAQGGKGNLIFYKVNENAKNIIYIAEPGHLTSRTYNSLLSLIEVIYDSNTSNLFSKSYKRLENGTFNNLLITVNYNPTEKEIIYNKLLSNYKILKLEIN